MPIDVDYQADVLVTKVKHYLLTTMGTSFDVANSEEFYRALCLALREEIMINWLATEKTYNEKDVRTLYYISMEFLPGRILSSNISNLNDLEVVKLALHKMKRNLSDIIRQEPDPGLGNGGLGRLASCFLDSLATLDYPARAYGLRYQYGIFEQQLWEGKQIEAPDCWLLNANPWEFRRDLRKVIVKYAGQTREETNIHGDEIMTLKNYEEVFALPYDIPIVGYSTHKNFSVGTLRLWSTKESPHNFRLQRYNAGRLDEAAENSALTDVLYPSDHHETGKRVRLKQEYLLVSATLQDIIRHYLQFHDNFRSFVDKVRIQINDTHPALVIAELIRILTAHHDIPWKMAKDITAEVTSYTNHTILAEALEQWDQSLMYHLLPRQYRIIERLNYELCAGVRLAFPGDEEKIRRMSILENNKVRMANLCIAGTHSTNGVAALHTEILKHRVFKDFFEIFPERFCNVTNGVTQRRWLLQSNPELAKLITNRIGSDWIKDFSQIKSLARFATDLNTQVEFMAIKKRNKVRLIDYITRESRWRSEIGEPSGHLPLLDADSIFDVQIKRVHEYKRQLLNLLHIIMLYHDLSHPNEEEKKRKRFPRTFIFAGKAAASYETAKDIIRLIYCVSRRLNKDPVTSLLLKVVYLENYNVSLAEMIIPAANVSEQISTAGTEASGTGNMKLAINGALTIGTDDGANIEMKEAISAEYWPFTFGTSHKEIETLRHFGYNPKEIYETNPKIKRALNSLIDRSFAMDDLEHEIFCKLYKKLLEEDPYFVLKDLEEYYNAQLKVESLYQTPSRWAEYAIQNMAGMGAFSTDTSIKRYSDTIWGLVSCPPDQGVIERIRHEYSMLDKCRIY